MSNGGKFVRFLHKKKCLKFITSLLLLSFLKTEKININMHDSVSWQSLASCSVAHKVAQSNQVKSSFMNYQNYVIIFLENSTKSEHKAPNFSNGSFGRNFLFISAASPISIHRITFEHGVISNTCFLDGFQGRNFCVCSNKTKVSVSIWWCDQDRTDTA